jgi:hypothetical protein
MTKYNHCAQDSSLAKVRGGKPSDAIATAIAAPATVL